MGYKLHLSKFPHSYPHSSHFAQPKDTLLKLLVFTLTTIYNMDSRCYNKRSPSQMHLAFLYALISISSNFCCLHHSSTSTPHIIYHFLEQHVYFTKSMAQRSLAMTNLVVQTDNKKKNSYQKKPTTLLLHSTYYLTPHPQLHKLLFNATAPSTIHSSVQIMFSITHKQTRLPTHVFLVAMME
jgi:hypothetical protein